MVADAERHRDEDQRLRQLTEARNALDAAAYQVERQVGELGGSVPVHEKARADTLVADARQALKDNAPLDRLRDLTTELQQVYHSLGATASAPQDQSRPPGSDDDDVIDAEFTPND
jgi:molecular chaperone DnaK